MRKKDRLADIRRALEIWGEWSARMLERSAIGFPHETMEQRLVEHGGELIRSTNHGSSICPDLMMPNHIADVDREIKRMGDEIGSGYAYVVQKRYIEMVEKLPTSEYERLRRAICFLAATDI